MTKITKNGKMTLDKLAGMMARGFEETNKRMDDGFEFVNERLVKLTNKVEGVEMQVFELRSKESVTDKEISILKRRTMEIERKVMTK